MTNILLVDDSENDRLLVRRVLERGANAFSVSEAEDALGAIAYLLGHGDFSQRNRYPIPELVICDIYLSGKTGFDFVDMVRSDGRLEHIHVALMSGTSSQENRELAFKKGACACIDKGDLVKDPAPFLKAVDDCLRDISAVSQ